MRLSGFVRTRSGYFQIDLHFLQGCREGCVVGGLRAFVGCAAKGFVRRNTGEAERAVPTSFLQLIT